VREEGKNKKIDQLNDTTPNQYHQLVIILERIGIICIQELDNRCRVRIKNDPIIDDRHLQVLGDIAHITCIGLVLTPTRLPAACTQLGMVSNNGHGM
jgi:hypothetical protein